MAKVKSARTIKAEEANDAANKSELPTDEQIDQALTPRKNTPVPDKDYLSMGSSMLNLACSGRIDLGIPKGRYLFVVGDSSSGKSFLTLTCLAEAAKNEEFAYHRFIYDNAEDGALMDMEKFFGKRMAARLEPPALDDNGEPDYSTTIEEFYYNIDSALKSGDPCIYILDSMDSLSSESEGDKFQEHKTAHAKGKTAPGSYGDGKAKANSAGIRQVLPLLRKTGSILIILSQTRANLGFGAVYNPKIRSGGNALRFYAHMEIWSSIKRHINKTVNKKSRETGIVCEIDIKKNRLTGRLCSVELPIYWGSGFDDVGGMCNYLVEEGHWNQKKSDTGKGSGPVTAQEFSFTGSMEKLVELIETKNFEDKLKHTVSEVWQDIHSQCEVKRKKRYV